MERNKFFFKFLSSFFLDRFNNLLFIILSKYFSPNKISKYNLLPTLFLFL